MTARITAIINGYGVPEDIRTDRSYHAYLVQVVNWLWERHRADTVTIVPCGGKTDMRPHQAMEEGLCPTIAPVRTGVTQGAQPLVKRVPPYRRTEAGEMMRWLSPSIRSLGLASRWHIAPIATELTALENMLAAAKRHPTGSIAYFCEWTRLKKMRALAKRVFGKRATVVGIEFDGSAPRYDLDGRRALEREDLAYSLAALKDPAWRRMLREAAEEKIRVLRATSERIRATEVDRIAQRIRREFRTRYERSRRTPRSTERLTPGPPGATVRRARLETPRGVFHLWNCGTSRSSRTWTMGRRRSSTRS